MVDTRTDYGAYYAGSKEAARVRVDLHYVKFSDRLYFRTNTLQMVWNTTPRHALRQVLGLSMSAARDGGVMRPRSGPRAAAATRSP